MRRIRIRLGCEKFRDDIGVPFLARDQKRCPAIVQARHFEFGAVLLQDHVDYRLESILTSYEEWSGAIIRRRQVDVRTRSEQQTHSLCVN